MIAPLLEQTVPGISAGESLHSKPAGAKNKSLIACDGCIEAMTPSLRETRKILLGQNLRVLDPPARFPNFSFARRHGFKRLLRKDRESVD